MQKEKDMNEWVKVEDRLPVPEKGYSKEYIVCLSESHWPTSTYDISDAPYSEERVTSAWYDPEQKIWRLGIGSEINLLLNALILPENAPVNGFCITHWREMPQLPKE